MTLKDFWEQPLSLKWVPVVIEGSKIKDRYLRDQLFARLDELTSPYMSYGGRNGIRSAIANEIDMPIGISGGYASDITKALGAENLDEDDIFYTASDITQSNINKWIKWWGYNPFSGDGSIFGTRVNSGKSFFNVRTGSIKPTLSYIGKYPTMDNAQKEIEWFAKEFPCVDLYLTFYNDEEAPFGTIHLFNGKITLVKTRNYSLKKLDSYSQSWIEELFRRLRNDIGVFFHRNILRLFDKDGYVYWHNYSLLNEDYSDNRILSSDKIFKKIHFWFDMVLEEKGSFQKYKKVKND